MPRIPDYRSQAVIAPTTAGAAISEQAAEAPWLAMSEAASKAESHLSDLSAILTSIKQVQAVSNAQVGSAKEMFELQNGLLTSKDFYSNPEGIKKAWEQGVTTIKEKYLQTLPDDMTR